MTGPIVHELRQAVLISGDENFPVAEYTEAYLTQRLLRELSCLRDPKTITVTREPFPDAFIRASSPAARASTRARYPASCVFVARVPCPTPDTCSLNPRKADR